MSKTHHWQEIGEFVSLRLLDPEKGYEASKDRISDPYFQACTMVELNDTQDDLQYRLQAKLPLRIFQITRSESVLGLCGYTHSIGDRAFVCANPGQDLEADAQAEAYALMAKHYFETVGCDQPWFTMIADAQADSEFFDTLQDYGFDDFTDGLPKLDPSICKPYMMAKTTYQAYYGQGADEFDTGEGDEG